MTHPQEAQQTQQAAQVAPSQAAMAQKQASAPQYWPFIYTLTKPIPGHNGEVRQLRLREVMGGDYVALGWFATTEMDDKGIEQVKIPDPAKLLQWVARLDMDNAVTPDTLAHLNSYDLMQLMQGVAFRIALAGNSAAGPQT